MRYIYWALALCVLASSPACALTYVSSCGTLSGDTVYQLTANLSSSSTTCLEMSYQTGFIELDCNGHSITMSGSGGLYPLYYHDNNAKIYWHGCTFISSTAHGYGSGSGVAVYVTNNGGYDPNRDGTGTSTWSLYNTYIGGGLVVVNTPYTYSEYDTFTDSYLACWSSDYCYVQYDYVDNSGHSGASGKYGGAFYFNLTNHAYVKNSTVIGYPGTEAQGGNVDDAVVFVCDGGPVTAPTTTCYDALVDYLTATDVFDAAVEYVGQWAYTSVSNGTFTRPAIAGIGCFGSWACSMDNGWFTNNSVVPHSSSTAVVSFTAHSTYGGFFTNNTFSGNSLASGSSNTSHLGYSGSPWGTFSGNTATNNNFGSGAYVYVQQASGMTDGGGNYCAAAAYAITCH